MKLSDRPLLVVLGSTLALTVGNGPIMQFTFGSFLKPITEAFGIDRGQGSAALTVGLVATALTLPFAGKLADKFGPKRLGIAAVLLFALGVAATAQFSTNIWTFIVLFTLAGVAAAGQTPLVYMKAIAARIDRNRGIALATALTGVGIGQILLPKYVAVPMIEQFGWRGGYLVLAALLVMVAIPALLLFIPNNVAKAPAATPDAAPVELPGLTPGEALRSGKFWLLVGCLFLAAGAANGTIAHVQPILTDRGLTAGDAASIFTFVGFAAIGGRLIGGFLIDRIWAPLVSLVFFTGMIGGIGLLMLGSSTLEYQIAMILLGLGLGVEADLVGFLVSRYLGTRAFGTLFGYAFAAFMLASSSAPFIMGQTFASTGSYNPCLIAFMVLTAVSAIGFLTLGKYAYPAAGKGESAH